MSLCVGACDYIYTQLRCVCLRGSTKALRRCLATRSTARSHTTNIYMFVIYINIQLYI